MAASLKTFLIHLDNPDCEFSPGEVVSGKIVLVLGREKNVRGIRVRLKGSAKVEWSERSGSDSNTTTYSNSEEYVRSEFYVVGSSGDDNVTIQPGRSTYPFNFPLPRNIPSSFETKHGNVRYTIKATIDRPWKLDHTTTVTFTVVTPSNLSELPSAQIPIEDEEDETFCCFPCFTMGTMGVHFYMPMRGFAAGEALEAKIDLQNNSTNVDVESIKLKIEQVIKLNARSKTKKKTYNVQETRKMGPFARKTEITLNMQVPVLPTSNLTFCNIIDIYYRLVLKIYVSGCHCTVKRAYPILIGTRPVLDRQPESNRNSSIEFFFDCATAPSMDDDTSTPKSTIPFPMPMISSDGPIPVGTNPSRDIYPPPIPRSSNPGFQYPPSMGGPPIGFVDPHSMGSTSESPEKPPPSYDDCMKMAKNGGTKFLIR